MDISQSQYWSEIAALAKEVTAQAIDDETPIHDVLHESVDMHQWVIYTAYNFDVAKHSPNDDAWTDLYGGGDVPENFDAVRAYCAIERDVCEHAAFNTCPECGDGLSETNQGVPFCFCTEETDDHSDCDFPGCDGDGFILEGSGTTYDCPKCNPEGEDRPLTLTIPRTCTDSDQESIL